MASRLLRFFLQDASPTPARTLQHVSGKQLPATRQLAAAAVQAQMPLIPDFKQPNKPILTKKYGPSIVHDPKYNKSTAWPYEERDRLGIRGLLPSRVSTIEEQLIRVVAKLRSEPDDVAKYLFLTSLQDRNETLFYRLLQEHLTEVAPIIYTPTVGRAAKQGGMMFRRSRGMYFSALDAGQMHAMVYNWPEDEIDIIVVTDGSRILGLGDLGVQGMAIPIGKLSLYVAGAGIDPRRALPVVLDVGTDNPELLTDPLYLGLQQPRLKGDDYFKVVDEFMHAVRTRWPNVLVQFEDFNSLNAHPILHKYRHTHLCFNDDIQGTGAVTLAGILGGLRAQGQAPSAIKNQRIVCVGAGSAGLGVCYALYDAMIREGSSHKQALQSFYMYDNIGVLTSDREDLNYGQRHFARTDVTSEQKTSLVDLINEVQPTILLGLSGQGGVFTEEVVKSVAAHCAAPIIFPLSNPTVLAECTAEQVITWSEGRAFFASGSPFDVVHYNGVDYHPNQCNNMFIFPGLGLGAIACQAKRITPELLYASAKTLASFVSSADLRRGRLYPRVDEIRQVSAQIATNVVELCIKQGLAQRIPALDETTAEFVARHMWNPSYSPIVSISDHL